MVENSLLEARKVDRKSYLKAVAAGLVGVTALSNLKDLPEANANPAYLELGADETVNNAGGSQTGMQSSTSGLLGTLYAHNTSTGIGVYGESYSTHGVHGISTTDIGVYGETGSGNPAIKGVNTGSGTAVHAEASNGYGVYGYTGSSFPAIKGYNGGTGIGVRGDSNGGDGVYGASNTGCGVFAESDVGCGVRGESSTGVGVLGATGPGGIPIVARGVSGQTANLQEWQKDDTALTVIDKDGKLGVGTSTPAANIHGETGQSYPAIKGRNTGIGDGIRGESSSGYGLIGTTAASSKAGMYGYGSGSAIGVRAKSVSGFALFVDGKNYFKSAQRGTIPSGVSSCIVTVPSGVTIRSAAMIFVTLMSPPNVSVKWVQRLSDTQFKIWLTGATSSTVAFGYFIVN